MTASRENSDYTGVTVTSVSSIKEKYINEIRTVAIDSASIPNIMAIQCSFFVMVYSR